MLFTYLSCDVGSDAGWNASCCCCAGPPVAQLLSTWRLPVDDLCEYIIVDIRPANRDDRFALHEVTDIAAKRWYVVGFHSVESCIDVFVVCTWTFVWSQQCTDRSAKLADSKSFCGVILRPPSGGTIRSATAEPAPHLIPLVALNPDIAFHRLELWVFVILRQCTDDGDILFIWMSCVESFISS